ncbi:hypothetical protein MHF_0442 [Mycoplasma haemofelis Ohio2]|uniref:Uncharacterized protein n=1 Tax=Mycoplasma haemofelis (strain Ohio2) TaxID=859194 RepID=F6FHH9_MYCHI|nr:hypothetical protein MHF_0442 [Mycoplasma haemofelis Ohio2]
MGKWVPALGILGVGGVAGLGTALFHDLSDKTESIKDRLLREGFKILKNEASDWSSILSSYKDAKNTWKFKKEHSTSEGEIQNESDLKRACSSVLSLKSSLEEVYRSVVKWCVVPRKAEEFVSGLLGVVESDESDLSNWKHNVDSYRGTKKSSENKYAWDDVKFESGNNDKEDTKKLKKGCKTRREKLTYDVGFDDAIKEVKERCLEKRK